MQGGNVVKTVGTRNETRLEVLLLLLMGIVILLMVAVVGLFLRMNKLKLAVLGALAPSQTEPPGQDMSLEIGEPAPHFTLLDTEGSTVSLRDFEVGRTLLAFSSAQCPVCTEMYSHLKAFSESQKDMPTVMISLGSSEENQQLAQVQGFAFPVLPVLTWDDPVIQDYRMPGTPFFYVIDEGGIIIGAGFASTLQQLEVLVSGAAYEERR
jgi:peroxiredoxin